MESSMEKKFIKIQNELRNNINLEDNIDLMTVKIVAGVDLAYWTKEEVEYAVCCIVVIDNQTYKVIEEKYVVDKVNVPYIPGCLAFREILLFMKAYEQLENEPELIFFDGNGYLHSRHMGLATHAGIILNKPTIGIAKSYYKIENVDFDMPRDEQYAFTDIEINGEVYGRVLRTKKGVKPMFVSVGNKIELNDATDAVVKMIGKESHVPIPTRLADIMTHKIRNQYI